MSDSLIRTVPVYDAETHQFLGYRSYFHDEAAARAFAGINGGKVSSVTCGDEREWIVQRGVIN